MPEASIHFRNVTLDFGTRVPLFEDLSCSFSNVSQAGKVVALMGPSGVGKTTFCDLALGLRKPKHGSVTFAPSTVRTALIPQKGVIFEELSVKENISCLKYSNSFGKTFRDDKVWHAVESLGLSKVVEDETSARVLSGGEAQRVMLARVETVFCDCLILDEPCSFLDNRVKSSFLAALRSTVDDRGLLALMVTHVWDEARLVADEVVFFHQPTNEPVSLHRLPTSEAPSRPPTTDALFSIHWPDCMLIEVDRIPSSSVPTGEDISPVARFVGLFPCAKSESAVSEWADALWTQFSPSSRSSPLRSQISAPNAAHFGFVLYDSRGVALDTKL